VTRKAALEQGLQEKGWTDGRNAQIIYRWGLGTADNIRKSAVELVALAPDLIVASGIAALAALLQATSVVPIIFVFAVDPVGDGFVDSLAQPGGNATGFMAFEYSISAKWLEILKQIAPGMTRAAVLRDATLSGETGQFAVIQSVAPQLGVDVKSIGMRNADEIGRSIATFARSPNGGLIVPRSASAAAHLDLIVTLAARFKLPAMYYERSFVSAGGLISYGPNLLDQYRSAAGYVDRILKGMKPADLPVQAPTRYELVLNMKTAKALGIEIPPTLLARADEVIE